MKLNDKNILLISPEPWNHIFVSKHHYATHLAQRQNLVFFLNPPSEQDTITKTDFEGVFSVAYSGFPRGLRFYPGFLQRYFIQRKYSELQTLCKTKFDIIWAFDNSVFFDFSALPKRVLKISHIVDLNQNFQFKKATYTADLNLTNTRTVLSKQLKFNPNSYFINHGFANRMSEKSNFELKPVSQKIKIGYAGNLDILYLDWNLINRIVKDHQYSCDFFFAGSIKDNNRLDWIKSNLNTSYVGLLHTNELNSFYSQMDILLVCYKADQYRAQLENSHKMMEYLGSGKMIVATNISEYRDLAVNQLIMMSNVNNEFNNLFSSALGQLDDWNSEAKQAQRRSYALDNKYDKQISRIEALLKKP